MAAPYTRLGEGGYGVRRYSSFAGKENTEGGPHPVGIISRFGEGGYGVRRYGSFAGKQPAVFVPPSSGGWDTSDPIFYDWWRKRAKEERAKLEVVQEIIEEAAPVLREETIAAVEAATSVSQIQSLDLLKYERDILKAAIADYQRMIDEDEEEAAILLLMH